MTLTNDETGIYTDICRLSWDYFRATGGQAADSIRGQAIVLLSLWQRLTADKNAWDKSALAMLSKTGRIVETPVGTLRFVPDEAVPANTVLIHNDGEWGRMAKPLVYVLPEVATT